MSLLLPTSSFANSIINQEVTIMMRHYQSQRRMSKFSLAAIALTFVILGTLYDLRLQPVLVETRRQLAWKFVLPDPSKIDKKPPVEDSTIVTAYFTVPSKRTKSNYYRLMMHVLRLQDYLVIFTDKHHRFVLERARQRVGLLNRTRIITMELEDNPYAKKYPKEFWEHQFEMSFQKDLQKSYHLYQIWLCKTWFVDQTISMDPFGHQVYIWLDIAGLREATYDGELFARHPEIIPRHQMLMQAWRSTAFTDGWARKVATKYNGYALPYVEGAKTYTRLYQAGNMFAGRKNTWKTFHLRYMEIVDKYVNKGWFVGEDQFMLQTTCSVYNLCQYVTADMLPDSPVWRLLEVLFVAGKEGRNITKYYIPPLPAGNAFPDVNIYEEEEETSL